MTRRTWISLLLSLLVLMGYVAYMGHRRTLQTPAPVPYVVPSVSAYSAAQTSSIASSSTEVVVQVRKKARPKIINHPSQDVRPALHVPKVEEDDEEDYDVVVRVNTSTVASSSAQAGATASLPPPLPLPAPPTTIAEQENVCGRLGLLVGTYPGTIAADFQVVRLGIPRWLIGRKIALGLDIEANHKQIGAGVSVGDKMFGAATGYIEYNDVTPKIGVAVGLRF